MVEPEPNITIPVREYIDLRIGQLKSDGEATMKVQDEKRAALEKISDLRITTIENTTKGTRAQIWVVIGSFSVGVAFILVDIFIRRST